MGLLVDSAGAELPWGEGRALSVGAGLQIGPVSAGVLVPALACS